MSIKQNYKQIKKNVILILILLPVIVVSGIITTLYLVNNPNDISNYIGTIVIISFVFIFLISFRLKILSKVVFQKLNLKELIIIILVVSILLIMFYIEKVYFGNYLKKTTTIYFSLVIVVFLPMVEEIFMKLIIIDNLLKININKNFIILYSTIYFSLIHFPSIYLVHIFMGFFTSYIYLSNKKLSQVILIHILYNFCIIIYNFT